MKINSYNIFDKNTKKNFYSEHSKVNSLVIVRTTSEKNTFNEFIVKVLQSIHIKSPDEYIIMSLDEWTPIANEVLLDDRDGLFIIFGVTPQEMGLQMNHMGYELLTLRNNTFLFVDDLEKISTVRKMKVDLWNALKPLSTIAS